MLDYTLYLDKLQKSKDNFSIKVITGMRGTGKTNLLLAFINVLKNENIPSENIIYLNFDEMKEIYNFQQLYEYVNGKIAYLEQAYLIFDEIQRVEGWEKTINAFFVGLPVDIYIVNSNNGIISETFLNLLSEHYEEIKLQTRSFKDYIKIFSKQKEKNIENLYRQYLKYGGLPFNTQIQEKSKILPELLSGLYHKILNKDIVARYAVRDVELVDEINKCLALNIGKSITPNIIYSYLENVGKITNGYTLSNYLKMISESGLFYRVARYDIKNKEKIHGSEQMYCADLGIRNFLCDFKDNENKFIIENIVYLELLRRDFDIFIGKFNKSKINFVAFKDSQPFYFQAVANINDKTVLKKVLPPLRRIEGENNKIIISAEPPTIKNYNGIKIFSIFDFLNEEY